jgi:flavin reductase (DIM6/NTAB) family NADH-FMN oxidoreductase RutF
MVHDRSDGTEIAGRREIGIGRGPLRDVDSVERPPPRVHAHGVRGERSRWGRTRARTPSASPAASRAGAGAGCLVGFASPVSIHPPRFLVGLSDKNGTYRVALGSHVLVVHFVPEDATDLAELFGGETGDDVDTFAACAWRPGPEGAPILCEFEDWFACRIVDRFGFGDRCGFLLEPIDGEARRGQSQLTFHRAKRIDPGHDP